MNVRVHSLAIRRLLHIGAIVILHLTPLAGQDARSLDASQAYLMLDLLGMISEGGNDPEILAELLNSEGTALVVGQMNLARRVSLDQYNQLIVGLVHGVRPDIQPVDSTRRARRGVDALVEDVWPRLIWGLDHVDILRERVDYLQDLDVYDRARTIATRFLPEPLQASPSMFAVMGGRAGGAKIGADRLYLDVLAYSYRDRRQGTFPADAELTRTMAHEMHHIGYDQYLSRQAHALRMNESEELIFGFISGLLSEGSATYLISEDRDLDRMRQKRTYAEYLARDGELMSRSEEVLRGILEGELRTRADYEAATADMLGNWTHATGSLMLSVIDEGSGLERVMEVVADPRRLLDEYNRAATTLGPKAGVHIFDRGLAETVLHIGG